MRFTEISEINDTRIFNPFLKLKYFDGCHDTPVEFLHIFLLGAAKYLFKDFMSQIPESNLKTLEAHWRSFNSDSLNIPPIQARFMVVHYKSFIGKHFCTVIQAAPFVFFPFMNKLLQELCIALCYVGSMIFQTQILHMGIEMCTQMLLYHM